MYKKLFEFVFFVILITIMVMSLNLAITDSTGMDIKLVDMFKYTFMIVLTAAILIKYPITLIGAAAVALGSGIYVYAKQIIIPAEVIRYFSDFFAWLANYIIGSDSFDVKYSLIFAILYIVFVTLITSLIVFSRKGYGVLIALGTSAFAFFWFLYVEKARLYLFYFLFAALILYSYNVYDRKKTEWVSTESHIDKNIELKWIFNSLIIVLISVSLAQFAVIDIKPVKWTWLNEKAMQAFPFIQNWRNDNFEDFSFNFGSKYGIDAAGYKTAKLGGPVKLSNKIMLIVETNATDNIYLRGTVKDFYTGFNWKKTKKNSLEHNSSTPIILPFTETVNTYSKELRVTHQDLMTSTIFAPNTLESVKFKNDKYYLDQDNEAYFKRRLSKKDNYSVKAEVPYINVTELRKVVTSGITSDIYKQQPDNITPRVRELAMDITSKYNNDYDKAKAIEKYLRENYKYTLNPTEVPEGAEFVDYFLFEGKEGYCTYFASSMAVLLRASGIPCRYIEGFLAKYDNSSTRNVPGTDAHAWVEVNFGSYGWINFEATPAYPLIDYRTEGEVPTEIIPEPTPNVPIAPVKPVDTTSRDRSLDLGDEETGADDVQTAKDISLTTRIILVFIAILIIRILYLLLKRAYIEINIKKSKGKQYSVMYLQDLLRYLKKVNLKISKDETMREFWFRVKYNLEEDYQNGDEIISLLERARYGYQTLSDTEIKLFEDYRKMLKKHVTARLGTVKAFLSYYIIGL